MFLEHQINVKFDPSQIESIGLVTKTTEDLTLYVRTDGDDQNTGTSEDDALATIQEAVDRIPQVIAHAFTIDIGEGVFDGFILLSKIIPHFEAPLTIQGKLGHPRLSSGRVEGTADGGNTIVLKDATQNWKEDELRGKLLKIGEDFRLIRSNYAGGIILANPFPSTCNGRVYEILEQKTVVKGVNHYEYSSIDIGGMVCSFRIFTLKDLKVEADPGKWGLYIGYSDGGNFERIHVSGGRYGVILQSVEQEMNLWDVYAEDATIANFSFWHPGGALRYQSRMFSYGGGNHAGIVFESCGFLGDEIDLCADNAKGHGVLFNLCQYCLIWNFAASGNGGSGLRIRGSGYVGINKGEISNNERYGIEVDESEERDSWWYTSMRSSGSCVNTISELKIIDNVKGGIIGKHSSNLHLLNVSGENGGFGLWLMDGSKATIDRSRNITSITGKKGDATIDEGESQLHWEEDFPRNGSKQVDLEGLCLISRRDLEPIKGKDVKTRAIREEMLPQNGASLERSFR